MVRFFHISWIHSLFRYHHSYKTCINTIYLHNTTVINFSNIRGSGWPTCWYWPISRSLMALRFRPLRFASLIPWYLVDKTKAWEVHQVLYRYVKDNNQVGVKTTNKSPETAVFYALKSAQWQKRKGSADGAPRMLVWGGWAWTSGLPMQFESKLLHLSASLF